MLATILLLLLYLPLVNAAAFLLYWTDKERAVAGEWRISERTLLMVGFAGGTIGSMLAQQVFRHKSRKQSFQNAFWMILTLEAAGIVFALTFLLD